MNKNDFYMQMKNTYLYVFGAGNENDVMVDCTRKI